MALFTIEAKYIVVSEVAKELAATNVGQLFDQELNRESSSDS